jgi:6,7-dimethyl-8-ribityllumazine synthase
MATINQNLSAFDPNKMPDASNMRIGIAVAEWNSNITENLLKGALETLRTLGVPDYQILVSYVPGSFELPLAAQMHFEHRNPDGVIVLGSVIQGETRHFEFVCQAAVQGVKDVGLKYNKPVILGLLTDDTLQQAIDRSGGKHGNKGVECAVAIVKMIALKKALSQI